MLKLPTIVWGLVFALSGLESRRLWLLILGLALLALGLFFFGWDFGSAVSPPEANRKQASKSSDDVRSSSKQ